MEGVAGWQTTFSLILAVAFWAQGSCREKQWPFWRSSCGAVGGRARREAQQAGSSRQESWNKQKGLLTAEKRLRSWARYTGVSIGAWREALNYIQIRKLLKLASEEVKIEYRDSPSRIHWAGGFFCKPFNQTTLMSLSFLPCRDLSCSRLKFCIKYKLKMGSFRFLPAHSL